MDGDPIERARTIARVVLAEEAPLIDRRAELTPRVLDVLRAEELLNLCGDSPEQAVPLRVAVDVARALARGCGATALVWSTHTAQLMFLQSVARNQPWFAKYVSSIGLGQPLLTSSTREAGERGAEPDRSAFVVDGAMVALRKDRSVISYPRQADAILVSARRHVAAAPDDRAAALVLGNQVTFEDEQPWNAMGMRGWQTGTAVLHARFAAEQLVAGPYEPLSARTPAPVSYVLWVAVWLGLAEEAVDRAAGGVGRRRPGNVTALVGEAQRRLLAVSGYLASVTELVQSWQDRDCMPLSGPARLHAIKVTASHECLTAARLALEALGVDGYREDSPHSVGRIVRDLHSSLVMHPDAPVNDDATSITGGGDRHYLR
ncbi:acyl-CoA dehydrogenase family protein [Dactylosporangium matsuzakiense]|uniref:Acyl-CoA dehydrogenase n=1 Tax=Dactylosporangium matsuzakiense TaxID=53360 RepID=A0A9W6NJY6_9ACTN|nr:acyl-CoA dehydrogenase family protein [Dactylosporangium matsuzakiense]GLK99171.1 acyl-CoA dehydrogenase [Dactylosporangium matsuzakiense]